ncbi:hypothetical protein SAMN02990966_06887 [Rhodospirillales bacterium URHD0017]|nr:hypothetical protein SAMN02990966_06887 [Rhodospirillales bacterium URHD0017]
MLDFLGTIATVALTIFIISTLLAVLDVSRSTKIVLAALLGLWVGVATAGSAAGWAAMARPFPVMGLFVAAPLTAAVVATAWPKPRAAMLGLPLPLLVGMNVGRVFAVLFLLVAAEGRMSGPFPHSAGWGDIISGVVALPLIWLARAPAQNKAVLHLWNAFGMLDLVAAIVLGVMSAPGSLLQVFPDPGSEAMTRLPLSFVPTVLVPMWMVIHAIIWAKLRRA